LLWGTVIRFPTICEAHHGHKGLTNITPGSRNLYCSCSCTLTEINCHMHQPTILVSRQMVMHERYSGWHSPPGLKGFLIVNESNDSRGDECATFSSLSVSVSHFSAPGSSVFCKDSLEKVASAITQSTCSHYQTPQSYQCLQPPPSYAQPSVSKTQTVHLSCAPCQPQLVSVFTTSELSICPVILCSFPELERMSEKELIKEVGQLLSKLKKSKENPRLDQDSKRVICGEARKVAHVLPQC